MNWLFDPPPPPSLAIAGQSARYPVRRIWCVGRNYAAHVREMGGDPQRDPPFFFAKPADALLEVPQGQVGQLPYPPRTQDFHHEVELVLALGQGGRDLSVEQAQQAVFAVAVGLDMTRRDVQARARKLGQPWEMAKGFDDSAVCGPLHPVATVSALSHGAVQLWVNGQARQHGDLAEMIWSIPEIIADLSRWVELRAGDLIYTGTPEGVGPVIAGDELRASIDGVGELQVRVIAPAQAE